jgi:hypothetical protein
MPALSPVKKESVGLGGSRMGTKESKIATRKGPVHRVLRNKLKHTVVQIFFLTF